MKIMTFNTRTVPLEKKQGLNLSFLPLFCQCLLSSICLFLQIYHLLPKPVCLRLNHFKPRLRKLLFSSQVSANHFSEH